uniref:Uncharacterized protein n=1 Tax=Arundo donax TaxID=35708 RepID=A0A0A9F019_ARUDO
MSPTKNRKNDYNSTEKKGGRAEIDLACVKSRSDLMPRDGGGTTGGSKKVRQVVEQEMEIYRVGSCGETGTKAAPFRSELGSHQILTRAISKGAKE